MNTGFQHQRPIGFTAAVRSTPSPQHAGRLVLDDARAPPAPPASEREARPEENSFAPSSRR